MTSPCSSCHRCWSQQKKVPGFTREAQQRPSSGRSPKSGQRFPLPTAHDCDDDTCAGAPVLLLLLLPSPDSTETHLLSSLALSSITYFQRLR